MSYVDLCVTQSVGAAEDVSRLGEPLLDSISISSRPVSAEHRASDRVRSEGFFGVVGKPPAEVRSADVLGFITAQRSEGATAALVVLVATRTAPCRPRTVRRRLSTVSGLFAFLQARGDITTNPVPRGLPTRRERTRPRQGVSLLRSAARCQRSSPRSRSTPSPARCAPTGDHAMVAAMVLGGLRRCEVHGLRLADLRFAERRVFVAEGKGEHQRLVPISGRFFTAVRDYLRLERPSDAATEQVFVVLKGPRRGQPLSASGVDEVLDGARRRAGLEKATCHQLRHTNLTRLREAGMALEAI